MSGWFSHNCHTRQVAYLNLKQQRKASTVKRENHTVKALLTIVISALMALLYACDSDDVHQTSVNVTALPAVAEMDRVEVSERTITNLEATVPPQCYTKTEGIHNPCYVCHQNYDNRKTNYRMNQLDDGGIQGGYLFSDIGVTNHWQNLFKDRGDWIKMISDETILSYINEDNYSALQTRLAQSEWTGFIPDLEDYHLSAAAFDSRGIAKDGSGWVAFNYKPLPSTFWPTNGSTDDVVIRLPERFRTLGGEYNESVYLVNLAILEMNIKSLDSIGVFPVDEAALEVDLDGDLAFSEEVVHIRYRDNYVGDAKDVALLAQQFPQGTQLMHSVRYVGVSAAGEIVVPPRMKELRYMEKTRELTASELASRYDRERKEKMQEELPGFVDHDEQGFANGMGWLVQGFIEDYEGELRPQTFEESLFCMGCHSAIGTTIDQTFSFARKVTGPAGWGYINLKGMRDAASVTQVEGEILQYLKMSGGGNEFRENAEIRQKWFYPDGSVKTSQVKNADVYELITPSTERALKLNKSYTRIVRHQSYIYGRDAVINPLQNVLKEVDEAVAPLEPQHRLLNWDLRLNW